MSLCLQAFSGLKSTLSTCARWKCWQNHTLLCSSANEGWELGDQYSGSSPIGDQSRCVFYTVSPSVPREGGSPFSHMMTCSLAHLSLAFFPSLLYFSMSLLGSSPNKPPVCEVPFPGLLWEGQGIQTRVGGFGKEPSWKLEHPLCCPHP